MNWLTNFEEALEKSKTQRKPILLQFEMEGCGGCKKLYAETYPQSDVMQEMEEWFVLLKLDLIKDREIRRNLAAYWTPSFYFLDHTGKSYFNFNGYVPADELRIILRLGYAESRIPRGKYAEAVEVMSKDIHQLEQSPLFPKLLTERAIAEYIRSKDKATFMKTMAEIRDTYSNSLEAKMYFWDS